jgi:hypothetical protein
MYNTLVVVSVRIYPETLNRSMIHLEEEVWATFIPVRKAGLWRLPYKKIETCRISKKLFVAGNMSKYLGLSY